MEEFNRYKSYLENKMDIFINANFPSKINEQIKYMCSDGKKIRGILVLIFGKSDLGESSYVTNHIAILIEILHSVSLVLDDTPVMDNDNIRRNKLSFFKKYGFKYTFFYIYYCINKLLLDTIYLSRVSSKINLQQIISKLDDLISGQLLDINNNTKLDTYNDMSMKLYKEIELLNTYPFNDIVKPALLENIQLNLYKTGSLFSLAIDLPNSLNECESGLPGSWSWLFGILFQYSDDYLDLEQDIENDKPNICKILDREDVKKIIINGCARLEKDINILNINKSAIKYILNRIESRVC